MLRNQNKQHHVKKHLKKLNLTILNRLHDVIHLSTSKSGREIGNDVLTVEDVSKTQDGKVMLKNVTFTMNKEDKIILLGNPLAKSALLEILAEEANLMPDRVKWGVTTSRAYFPLDNSKYFEGSEQSLVEWLRQYSPEDQTETFLRGFLGRMLFSGEEVNKKAICSIRWRKSSLYAFKNDVNECQRTSS